MNQRAYDDFAGLLADCRESGAAPSAEERRRLLSSISYQSPGEIPGCLAAMSETLQIEPDEMRGEYDSFIKESASFKGQPLPGAVPRKIKPEQFEHRTDCGNSLRLVNRSEGKLRFCPDMNRWLIWAGDRWKPDETNEIMQYARAAVQEIYREAADLSDQTERKLHSAFAQRSESEHSLRAMVSLARSEPGVPILRADLDAHPFKLNVLNGVLDLETGELQEHAPEFYFTKIIPFAYDRNETAPRWMKFLDEITGGDEALQKFLQLVAGYCLTGSTREQVFFIFHGGGKNGKSTFIHVLLELLDGWSAQTVPETFLLKKGAGGFSDLARLADKRLVCAIETDENVKLAEGLIKSLSGNDRVAARHHYQEFFEYEPQFKIILTTNHRPRIRGSDCAIWRRVRLVPFTWEIPEAQRDPDLFDKLKTEMRGILTWAVKGCFEWQNIGKLESPQAVTDAVSSYQKEQDTVQRFVDDCCERGGDSQERAKTLYEKYKAWAVDSGEYYLSANKFGRRLQDLGFEKGRDMQGSFYKKIKLTIEMENEPDECF